MNLLEFLPSMQLGGHDFSEEERGTGIFPGSQNEQALPGDVGYRERLQGRIFVARAPKFEAVLAVGLPYQRCLRENRSATIDTLKAPENLQRVQVVDDMVDDFIRECEEMHDRPRKPEEAILGIEAAIFVQMVDEELSHLLHPTLLPVGPFWRGCSNLFHPATFLAGTSVIASSGSTFCGPNRTLPKQEIGK
jgi:hypothetical protein